MFSKIDFLSGEVNWVYDYLQEDMLLVYYPNNYILDVGWYEGSKRFVIYIVKDNEWGEPVAEYIIKEKSKLLEILPQVVDRIEKEAKNAKSYYGGLWKTEVIEID